MPRQSAVLMASIVLGVVAATGVYWLLTSGDSGPEEQFALAIRSLDEGESGQALRAIEALERHPGYENHVSLLDGMVMARSRRWDDALSHLASVPPTGELRLPLIRTAAECLYQTKRLSEAEQLLKVLLLEEPDNVDARRWLAAVYYDLGAFQLARQYLYELIEMVPDDYAPHHMLGMMHRDFEEDTQAVDHFQKALKLNPPPVVRDETSLNLARAHIALRQYPEALEVLSETRPGVQSLTLKAKAWWEQGERNKCLEQLELARQQDSKFRDYLMLQSEVHLAMDQPGDARKALEDYLETDPHDAEFRYQYARLLQQLGQDELSAEQMKLWEVTRKLATQRTELSIKAIEQPRNPEIRDQLARVSEQLGQKQLAEMWRRAAASCREASQLNDLLQDARKERQKTQKGRPDASAGDPPSGS